MKIITWNTPKKLQKSREDTRWHSKNKLCRVYKGPHQYTEKTVEYLGVYKNGKPLPWCYQWRCKCGKKGDYELIDPPKWSKHD